jgi:hypothetical protein
MAQLLKIPAWNANGLCQYVQEIKLFIQYKITNFQPLT